MERKLFDISEVCSKLHITSRALRFYEEKGIIESIRTGTSTRRYFSEEEFEKIKNILILRKLGISINRSKKYSRRTQI